MPGDAKKLVFPFRRMGSIDPNPLRSHISFGESPLSQEVQAEMQEDTLAGRSRAGELKPWPPQPRSMPPKSGDEGGRR